MIVYAIVGMPVNVILYSYLGEYFGKRVNEFAFSSSSLRKTKGRLIKIPIFVVFCVYIAVGGRSHPIQTIQNVDE